MAMSIRPSLLGGAGAFVFYDRERRWPSSGVSFAETGSQLMVIQDRLGLVDRRVFALASFM
jgi:hypothetical protein